MKLTPLILATFGLLTSTPLWASWTDEVDNPPEQQGDNQRSPPPQGQGDNQMGPPPQGMNNLQQPNQLQNNKVANACGSQNSGQCDLREHVNMQGKQ